MIETKKERYIHIFLLLSFSAMLVWSVIKPKDLHTWFMEIPPALIGALLLVVLYNRFRFTVLSYFLLWFQFCLVTIGAHYTYPKMPLFNWIKYAFHLSRNHYDRFGHFFLGFGLVIVIREALLRTSPLKKGKWLIIITIFMVLAVGAFYELLEWGATCISKSSESSFLGTQGDKWDTQWDMFLALIGSIISLAMLSKIHDKFLTGFGMRKG